MVLLDTSSMGREKLNTAPEPYLTKRDAARLLNVSVYSIDRWVVDGRLPHIKLHRLVRFRLEDLLAYVEARRVVA
jgi:excisionase family DNA binding protein